METVIVYGSCYGTAKIYAETQAEQMKCKVLPYDKVKETDGYETIIYVGGLYAGGGRGMAKSGKKISTVMGERFGVITGGLVASDGGKNVKNTKK